MTAPSLKNQIRIPNLLKYSLTIAALSTTANAQVVYDAQELSHPSPSGYDRFGSDISTDGNLLVVGARLDNSAATDAGSVHVFNANTGTHIRELIGSNVATNTQFGSSVVVKGNLILVGAQRHVFGSEVRGAAYFFNATTGAQLAFVGPTNPISTATFGTSVAMNSIISLVGDPGSINDDGGRGSVVAFLNSTRKQLVKFDSPPSRGDVRFGWSLAMNENFFLVGTPGNSGPMTSFAGEVYVYDVNSGIAFELLTADTPDPASQFGWDVAIEGTTAVVGAKSDDAFGDKAGAAYVFDVITGNQLARLSSTDPQTNQAFGSSVAIKNGIIAVGANRDDSSGQLAGAIYTFDANTFDPIAKTVPPQISTGSSLGSSVAIIGQTIIAGAENIISLQNSSGHVYMLDPYCRPDLNQDGNLDFFDISAFLDTSPDWNEDGSFDFFDISAYLNSFTTGCPELE